MLGDSGSRHALFVSLMIHAAALGTMGMVMRHEMMEPGGFEDEVPEIPAGIAGDTFDIERLEEGEPGPRAAQESDKGNDTPTPAPKAPPVRHASLGPNPAPKVPQTAGSASAEAQGGGAPNGTGNGGPRYGQADLPRGMLPLASAFARAVPAAVSNDRAWSRMAVGVAGHIEVTLHIDADGKIAQVSFRDPEHTPPHLQRLVDKTILVMRSGTFALVDARGPGFETLGIEVTLSQRAPIETANASPNDALRLGHDPPTRDLPGRAYFTLASGRHFEARIVILDSRGRAAPASNAAETHAETDAG
jgi:hypothetical protein